MSPDGRGEALRERLEAELVARLEPEGWTLVQGRERDGHELRFRRAVTPDVETIATLHASADGSVVTGVVLSLGVIYMPLRRLEPLLGDRCAWPAFADDIPLTPDDEDLEVRNEEEVVALAERVAKLTLTEGVAFGERYCDFGAIVAARADDVGDDEEEDDWEPGEWVDLVTPALLAAAGHYEQAGLALDRAVSSDGALDRDDRIFARRLRRWIDGRGDPALLPSDPPPTRLSAAAPRPGLGDVWRESRGRQAVVKALEKRADLESRPERRAFLLDELRHRGLTFEPRWLELQLDYLEMGNGERRKQGAGVWAKIGVGVLKAVRERKLPDLSKPEWLEPPDSAAYALPVTRVYVAAELDPDADAFLSRVLDAIPGSLGQGAGVPAWLHFDPDPQAPGSELAVCIGEGRVGRVPPDEVAAYLPHMEAAATRDEVPYLEARLTRLPHPPRMLLEVPLPR